MRRNAEQGVALITVMMILVAVSAIVVGMSWMVITDQRLGGNNQDRQNAFYGAEAGMEKLTADLGNTFATYGAVTGSNLTSAPINVTPVLPGITYQNTNGSTYSVFCQIGNNPYGTCPAVPPSTNGTVLAPSPYSGMSALITPFNLSVAAQTSDGAEVKLTRQIQLVAIPVFQFGIFSTTDLSFFAGPVFDFGGRVHTNGNLWLAANSGPLYMGDKVTASGQVILSNLENGYPGGGNVITAGGTYGGNVNIATAPLPIPPNPTRPPYVAANWNTLAAGTVTGPVSYGAVGTANNLNGATGWNAQPSVQSKMIIYGAPQLNLTSSALGGLTQPIFLIERPPVGELAANPGQFAERYFAGGASVGGNGQVSLRILLDDYGPSGTCTDADMTKLDTVTATVPTDLAMLAFGAGQHYTAAPLWYTAVPAIPLPTSAATGAAYSSVNGYWITKGYPMITGCIKIEYETAAGVFTDVTHEILNLGFTGANIYPKNWGITNPPQMTALPANGTIIGPTGCANPSTNAVIRLARLRDNPTTAAGPTYCGTLNDLTPTDYWPNVLYDTREGISRDFDPSPGGNGGGDPNDVNSNPYITAQGVMDYVELDVTNLQKWFLGTIGASGGNASNVGGYLVYFSDRRGNQIDNTAGVTTNNTKTGYFGFDDIINGPTDAANGCPNNTLDPGEDFVGDGVLRTYGGRSVSAGPLAADSPSTLGYAGFAGAPYIVTGTIPNMLPSPLPCGVPFNPPTPAGTPAPNYVYKYTQEARENPPLFFRRALKLVRGQTINLGTACFGAAPNPPCGLSIAAENPVYIQGEYNDGGVNTGAWTGASVAASVAGDSVTMLSNNWNDVNSFISPYNPVANAQGNGDCNGGNPCGRPAVTTSYRTAVISGKGLPFLQPAGTPQDYGTDGGLHNFLRYLENWGANGGQSLNYEGSLVSFYYSAQAIGPYKCCTTVYSPPTRNYLFDQNFTTGPQWLPPRTPTLRSINTMGFSQDILPTQ